MRCTEQDWDRLYDVTVKGIFHMTRAFVPLMARNAGAAIVNTGSILGDRPAGERAACASAKGSVNALRGHLVRGRRLVGRVAGRCR